MRVVHASAPSFNQQTLLGSPLLPGPLLVVNQAHPSQPEKTGRSVARPHIRRCSFVASCGPHAGDYSHFTGEAGCSSSQTEGCTARKLLRQLPTDTQPWRQERPEGGLVGLGDWHFSFAGIEKLFHHPPHTHTGTNSTWGRGHIAAPRPGPGLCSS